MLEFTHVDVFAERPYSGNSLPVVWLTEHLSAGQMLAVTRELRHFEAVFLERTDDVTVARARVFDLSEELPFAGHPLLGAAAALHAELGDRNHQTWTLLLKSRAVTVTTSPTTTGFRAWMDQGKPTFGNTVQQPEVVARAFSLARSDLDSRIPLEVVSTGLSYLIVPVESSALARAKVAWDIGAMLAGFGAQFCVLLDEDNMEVRHWNNDGVLEDVATGSAAGTIGAYRLRHGLTEDGQEFSIRQGRFAGRPSELHVIARGSRNDVQGVSVGGSVVVMGRGSLEAVP